MHIRRIDAGLQTNEKGIWVRRYITRLHRIWFDKDNDSKHRGTLGLQSAIVNELDTAPSAEKKFVLYRMKDGKFSNLHKCKFVDVLTHHVI